jgi:hypothetical protein
MATLTALAAIALLIVVVIAAAIGLMGVAIRREEKNRTLTHEAPDQLTRTARWLNGAYARAPRPTADRGHQPRSSASPARYSWRLRKPVPQDPITCEHRFFQHPEGCSPHAR